MIGYLGHLSMMLVPSPALRHRRFSTEPPHNTAQYFIYEVHIDDVPSIVTVFGDNVEVNNVCQPSSNRSSLRTRASSGSKQSRLPGRPPSEFDGKHWC